MASGVFAVIAGAGPGTGAAIARRFASAYPVALLARSPEKIEPLVQEIKQNGGKAVGVPADVTDENSVKAAFKKIQDEFKDATCAAAIFNASAVPDMKSLLEIDVEKFSTPWQISCKGGLIFSQASLPLLLKHAEEKSAKYPPTLIFTGATASLKASAKMSSFASAKSALRALSISIAKEFGPQGVHVAHAVIDGVIDTEATKDFMKDVPPEGKLAPESIAETYWNLHIQDRRGFTNEIDLRPMLEKW